MAAWLAVCLCAEPLLLASSGQEDSPKEQAAALAKKARKAAKSRHAADAYLYYSEAAALQPKNRKLKARMEALQTKAALEAKPLPPEDSDSADDDDAGLAPDLGPGDVFDSLTAREYATARRPQSAHELKAKPGKQDFDLTGNARALFDTVAKRFGLDTVYDGDYPAAGQQFRFRISGIDYREALNDLEAMTNSFVAPLSSRLFLVAQDTPQKRNDLEQTIAVAIPIPQALTTQELTQIAQAVKQTTNIEKMAWDTRNNTVVIRDRVSRVLPAQALFEQLFAWRAQVMIEVEFLEVSDSDIVNYGFTVPTSISAIYLGSIMNNLPSVPSGITNLLTFGGGKTLIGIGVAEVNALFNQTLSTAKTLFRAQVASVDGQPATFHVGEKYPVITQGYFGSTANVPAGTAITQPPPSFTFENLGVDLKITPYVRGDDEVTLDVDSSYELLTGSAVNGIPIFGSRKLKNQVSLRNDQWAIVAGLIGDSDSKNTSGFLGLDQIPLIGNLFKQGSKDREKENVLIAIRPHLLSLPPDQTATPWVRVGSETRPFIPL